MPAGIALGPLVTPRSASAHNPPFTNVRNGLFKIEPREAQVVVRVPLPVLEPAKFPLSGRELDLPQAGPAIDRALADLARQITIAENGRPLVPSSATGRLTLPSDRSFERYDDAIGHVLRPVALGTTLYADQAYFDAHLTYAITSPKSQFTIQTAVAPELKDYLKLAIRYLRLSAEGRAMVITSRSADLALNSRRFHSASAFVAPLVCAT